MQVTITQNVGYGLSIPGIVITLQLPFQNPKGASIPTPNISPTATLPRLVPLSRVEQPVTTRTPPLLAAQISKNETKEDAPAHKNLIKKAQHKSSTQEAMIAYLHVEQGKITLDQLSQRRFTIEMLSAVLDEDTGELMEYQKLKKKTATYIATPTPRI